MPINAPALVDPEIAAATLRQHIDELWATGRPDRRGWQLTSIDDLHLIVRMPAHRIDGTIDHYHILLGGEYYDAGPPTVAFVDPDTKERTNTKSKWFPQISPTPPWFGLHEAYQYPDKVSRQLVCFTGTAEYYMTDHSPKESEKWKQGEHTVAMTLNRLQEVLSLPYYVGPHG
jgi:hypothetical protein